MQNLVVNYDSFQLKDGLIQLLYDQNNDRYEIVMSKNEQKINMTLDINTLMSLYCFISNFVNINSQTYHSKPIVGWNENGAIYAD